jgi:hypothetical protein
LPFVLGEQAAHWRSLAHFDGVAVEAGQDPAQAEHVAVPDERLPPIEVATVRLAGHTTPEPFEVALNDRTPFIQASRGQADGEPAMELVTLTGHMGRGRAFFLRPRGPGRRHTLLS